METEFVFREKNILEMWVNHYGSSGSADTSGPVAEIA